MTPVPTPPDLRALTTLRFFAALWVVLYTAWEHLNVGFEPTLVSKGYLGVEVFFVLSGFILSHVYLEAAGEKRFSYRGFLWARIARVYPLHLATLIGVGGLAAADALSGLDPREVFTVEFVFRDGSVARTVFEAGDFAAGRAFLAMGQT